MIRFKISKSINSWISSILVSTLFSIFLDTVSICVFGNCLKQFLSNEFHKVLQWSQLRLGSITKRATKHITHLRYIIFSPSKNMIFIFGWIMPVAHCLLCQCFPIDFPCLTCVNVYLLFRVMVWFFWFFRIPFFANVTDGIILSSSSSENSDDSELSPFVIKWIISLISYLVLM